MYGFREFVSDRVAAEASGNGSRIHENEEFGGSLARRVLAEYRVQATLDAGLTNMPGEGSNLRPQSLLS